MKTEKMFDCVEMKAEIQERLLREVAEPGEGEARKRRAERLSRDPILGCFLRTKKALQQEKRRSTRQAREGSPTHLASAMFETPDGSSLNATADDLASWRPFLS